MSQDSGLERQIKKILNILTRQQQKDVYVW